MKTPFYNKFFLFTQMSDSEFQDLAVSSIKGHYAQQSKLKDNQIHNLNLKVKELETQLQSMRSVQSLNFSQLQKKNNLLKTMASDNIKLSKEVVFQEQQIKSLKEQILVTQKSLHETLSVNLSEKSELLLLNKELSESLMQNEQCLALKVEQITTLKKDNSQKSQLIKQMQIRLEEFWNNQHEIQRLNKELSQAQNRLNTYNEMQKQFKQQKKKQKNVRQKLQQQINHLKSQNIELSENITALRQEDANLQDKLKRLEKQILQKVGMIKSLEDDKDQLQMRLKETNEKIVLVQQRYEQIKQKNEKLQKELIAVRQQNVSLYEQLQTNKSKILQKDQQLFIGQGQSQKQFQTIHNLQQQMSKMAEQVSKMTQTMAQMQKQNQLLSINLKDKQQAFQSVITKNQQLSIILSQQQKKTKLLQKINSQNTQKLAALTLQLIDKAKKQNQIKSLSIISQNKNKDSINLNELKALQKKCKILQKENEQHIDTIEVIYKQCQSLRQETQQLKLINQKLTSVNKEITQTNQEIISVNKEITQTNQKLQNQLQRTKQSLKHKELQTATILKQFQQHLDQYNTNKVCQNQSSVQNVIQKINILTKNIQQNVAVCNLSYEEKENIINSQKEKLLQNIKSVMFQKGANLKPSFKQLAKNTQKKNKRFTFKSRQDSSQQKQDAQQTYIKFKEFNPFK